MKIDWCLKNSNHLSGLGSLESQSVFYFSLVGLHMFCMIILGLNVIGYILVAKLTELTNVYGLRC